MALDPFGSIASGELRHRIAIQRKVVTRDQFGSELTNWVDVFPQMVWARVQPLQGRELFAAQQVFPEANTQITVRGMVGKDVDVTMRVFFRNRQFDIVDVSDIDERRREAVITAVERPAGRNI